MKFKLLIVTCLALLIPETIFAADLPSMINSIYSKVKTWLAPIGTLVIFGFGFYIWKNMDRWKEIGMQCFGILVVALVMINADTIASYIINN
ncbi:hypothetical protein [Helicobacter sp. 10-6591]|uniref:hypothetical protein n=1 Tax=Helicobacter sp. 10-6591 TaxID=2004998 RepID=UPI000DCC3C50|nr:hypothetical protein [Helicobacter sp. 10-6591]RAX55452.1 hypothetical protein CCY97_04080 [Helicobacter sp. 10-6591]